MKKIEGSASIAAKAGTIVIEDDEIWFYDPYPSYKAFDNYAVRIPTFEYDDDIVQFLKCLRKAIDAKLDGNEEKIRREQEEAQARRAEAFRQRRFENDEA